MKWSKMEAMSAVNKFYCKDTQTTYSYKCETWLYDKQGQVVGQVERWQATSGACRGSIYKPWVFYEGQAVWLQVQDSLKESKALVLDSCQRLLP